MSEAKFGCDPRIATPTEPASPPPWTPGEVGSVHTTGELRGAVEAAAADSGGFVALKFWRVGCKACAATVERFASSAKEYPKGRFYLVNYGEAKEMCRASGLKIVPAAHLYSSGKLQDAVALGPSSWDAFAARLKEVADA